MLRLPARRKRDAPHARFPRWNTVRRSHLHSADMSRSDRVILGLLVFFLTIAFSLELYWLEHHGELVELAPHELFARLFQIYGDADRCYYDRVSPTAIGLESINVYFTQALNLWLMWAIVARAHYRHVLQLVVGSYLSYSVILYFWAAHVTGYPDMRYHAPYTYFLFYAPNLPWLLGYGFMAWHSARALTARTRGDA
jgi:hypothetical protein